MPDDDPDDDQDEPVTDEQDAGDTADDGSGERTADRTGDEDDGGPADDRRDGDEPNVPNPNEFLSDGFVSRRTLIRIVIAIAIGIPLVVEGLTFLGLIQDSLLGDGGENGGETTTTTTATDGAVGVGDELLPDQPNPVTVRGMQVRALEDAWEFEMTVEVVNGGGGGEFQFRLAAVTTDAGTTVTGGDATGRLAPGESTRLTGTWDLPVGERPASVQVIAITIPEEGSPETVTRQVELASVPVQR